MTPNDARKPDVPSLSASRTDLSDLPESATHRDLLVRRRESLGANLLFYEDPVHVVRGDGVWLEDAGGRRYLDCYNNVPSVGHCNPRVVDALTAQARTLNTHTRYLDETVLDYAEALLATLPPELDRCALVCTGTEANELALRMARTVTGQRGVIVMDWSYHGNSTLVAEVSTIGSKPEQRAPHVEAVEPPNTYRGPHRGEDAGDRYADLIDDAAKKLVERGQGVAAFLCDAIFDTHGGLEAPPTYFERAYAKVREAGGVCIADEVQAGFGRTGTFWGFQQYDVIPDIVTFGKPAGNGHPVAGVITRRDLFDRFAEKAIYFNTFGGNPVSAAVGRAVLEEIEDRDLLRHVQSVGATLREKLERLDHPLIGDVRGLGLYQAVELVSDRSTREPATEAARGIPDALRREGILLGLTGRYGNVLKIRPPLVFDEEHVELLVDGLQRVLSTLD